jgi:protein TonB
MGTDAASDRFLIALLLASLVHAALILGVGFEPPEPEKIRKSLPITLVYNTSREAPQKADFLAQDHQFGSGEAQEKAVPRSVPVPPRETAGQQAETVRNPVRPAESKPTRPVLKQEKSERKIVEKVAAEPREEPRPEPQPHRITAEALSQQIAELSTDFSLTQVRSAKQPRTVYLDSASAHKYKLAAYEKALQEKIERIGTLNFPEDIWRKKLTGKPYLEVQVNPDGTVHSVKVLRSSGNAVVDDAAVQSVRIAAPFAPFPEDLKKEWDIVAFRRYWWFTDQHQLETGH